MHIDNDRDVVTNTLALYGAKHRTPAYRAIRAAIRTLIVATPLIGGFAYSLIPA